MAGDKMKKVQKRFSIVFCLLYVILILVGCESTSGDGRVVVSGDTGLSPAQADENKEEETELGKVYILKDVNESTAQVVLIKVGGSYREYVLNYTGATLMEDRYGNALTPATLTYGEVFEIELSEDGSTLKSLRESKSVWTFEGVENFTLDQEEEILKIGKDKYHLSNTTVVFDGTNQYNRYQLMEEDVVTLIGYKKELLSVLVQTGHGILQFTNTEGFEEGYFVLGNVLAAKITQNMSVDVRAGHFLLSVAHKGKGGSIMVTVEPGQSTTVDLSQFASGETKSCLLTFKLKQEGTTVSINGKEVDVSEPVELTYGTYRITAELEGYETWSRLLLASSEEVSVTIDLDSTSGQSSTSTTENTDQKDDKDDEEEEEIDTDTQTNTLINEVLDMLIGD